ncbi:MAG: asparagine synthase (glutamine-hydrolyzing) [Anaerolineales bacterium]|nr:asparagine synthase (glutamine-hydrolyzing) [Anaerolineales bacterium]
MCGIVGYIHLNPSQAISVDLMAMNASIRHRGPDDDGFYQDARVGLAMRRLSIIDLKTGQQPMSNETGRLQVVFNGEIYNYRELRAKLSAEGHHFATQSDTEVLVHAYETWGDDLPKHLRGMFAFALWDMDRERLVLVRDHFGIKPLYTAQLGGTLLFASEIKALLLHPQCPRRLDTTAFDQYLTVRYIPEPRTIFQDIRALPPAHVLIVADGQIETRRYWSFTPLSNPYPDQASAIEAIRETVADSVRAMLVADVPLGAFLSGGIDSASVVAMMSRYSEGAPVKTFSIGFGEREHHWDELPTAKAIASHFKTEHHEFRLEPDIISLLPQIVRGFDQPFADPTALLLYILSQETRQHVTVALTGTGGDELLGGYMRYKGMMQYQRYARLPRPLRRGAARLASMTIRDATDGRMRSQRVRRFLESGALSFDQAYLAIVSNLDQQRKRVLYTADFRATLQPDYGFIHEPLQGDDPLEAILLTELQSYLPYSQLVYGDRMSMAQSLEVRVPLVDQRLIEVAGNIPLAWKIQGGTTKALFREAMRPFLPPEIVNLPKQGFVMPIALWLRGELRAWAEGLLGQLGQRGYFEPSALHTIFQEHLDSKRDHSQLIWTLVVLEIWHQLYFD